MSTQNFEQLINTYHALFVWCGIAAILLVLVAVFLFFWLKIPKIFDELTGRGAKKAIAEMSENGASGALTGRNIDQSGKRKGRTGILQQNASQGGGGQFDSGNLMTGQPMMAAAPAAPASAPAPAYDSPETTPLDEYYGETAPLSQGMVRNSAPAASGGFKVIRTIIEIHTDEVIPE